MPKKILYIALLNWLILHSIASNAISITDTIIVGDREWAQVDLFVSQFPDDVNGMETICSRTTGTCGNGALNGYDMQGWTWASVDDVNALFNEYIGSAEMGPGADAYFEIGSSWAPSFFVDGWRATSAGADFNAITGLTRNIDSGTLGTIEGSLGDGLDLLDSDSAFSQNPYAVFSPLPVVGGWFYREARNQKSAPAVIPTLSPWAMGILGILLGTLVFRYRTEI